MGAMWIFNDYFNVMILKHDEKTKRLFVDGTIIQIDAKWWKYNENNCYDVIIIDFSHCIKDSYNIFLL